jgi:SAM-dependent methyltransferase
VRRHRELNRKSWNAATVAHNSHKKDQAAFLRGGGSTLFPEELRVLGPLRGKRLLHLQCNSGQDTLSLAAHGAVVTGVDISDEAIAFATALARDTGRKAHFLRSDVFDFLETTRWRFERVFASYGVVGWLDDLRRWGRGVARVLERGGTFTYVDFHPAMWVYEEPAIPYSSQGKVIPSRGVTDYVALSGEALVPSGFDAGVRDFKNPHRAAEFAWGLGEIVQALIDAGLALELLEEFPFSNGFRPFAGMRALPGRRFAMAAGQPQVPLMFALRVRRPKR